MDIQREVAGYLFGPALYESDGFVIHSVRRARTEEPFLAKLATREFPALSDMQVLQNEFDLFAGWLDDDAGVLRPVQRVEDDRNSYLIYRFFDGRPLSEQLKGPWPLAEAMSLARSLLLSLRSCHEHGILHCGVNPSTVLWNAQRQELRLMHFAHARSIRGSEDGGRLAALTPFCAPEQTGQVAAGVDGRTDLYSAGAVLYTVLAGRAPFEEALPPADLVHRVLAQPPRPLVDQRADGAAPLMAFVTRLLSKSSAERPLTANEALEELDAVQSHMASPQASGSRSSPPLGAPRMHGRSEQLDALRRALDDAAMGTMQVALVSGPPGSGKSRLAGELRGSLARDKFVVASGKFEQYRQQRPYSALLAAMADLFERFLIASDRVLGYWRERFERVDPALLAVLTDQIPPLSHVVGEHEPPPRLGSAETHNRFQQAFRALFDVLCAAQHPLVLAIDDLQWSDNETIGLISSSLAAHRSSCFLLVVSYRPREALNRPRVREFIEERERCDAGSSLLLELPALSGDDIAALCNDIVAPCTEATALNEIVHGACRGSPLFALEIIKHLRQTGCLR